MNAPRPEKKPPQGDAGEDPLASLLSKNLFPGLESLSVAQVAKALAVTKQHVNDLIDEGHLVAIDIAGRVTPLREARRKVTPRRNWRIPCSAYDAFLRERQA